MLLKAESLPALGGCTYGTEESVTTLKEWQEHFEKVITALY